MTGLKLAAALGAVIYGIAVCAKEKQPLFFKILLYGYISYFMGALFTACYALVYQAEPAGFHVGCLGYTGAYFFLLSSYYGAIDRLADGGEREYRGYRMVALVAPLALLGITAFCISRQGITATLQLLLLVIPMGLTAYFAMKHLILPDVEMGIIRVMRPYNFCVILFCLCEATGQIPGIPQSLKLGIQMGSALLLLLLLPVAERGVRKWYI